jgi:hypothetical protein
MCRPIISWRNEALSKWLFLVKYGISKALINRIVISHWYFVVAAENNGIPGIAHLHLGGEH